MRRLFATWLALLLILPAHVQAAPGRSAPEGAVAKAEKAWEKGEVAEVRALLEPLAPDAKSFDPVVREKLLTILADATLNDRTLADRTRTDLASGYLTTLMDADSDWRLPQGMFSPELFELYETVRDARGQASAAECKADKDACVADLSQEKSEHDALKAKHKKLEEDYGKQEIEVQERVARSRALALIPFGVGHFYNAAGLGSRRQKIDLGLGIAFLTVEAALGTAGIALIVRRTVSDGCTRTDGFAPGSLSCTSDDRAGVERRRVAEEFVGWFFIGAMLADVVVAQIRFRPVLTQKVRREQRRVLDAPPSDGEKAPKKPKKQQAKRRAKVRPSAAPMPGGGGLGVSIRF